MPVTAEGMHRWCRHLLGFADRGNLALQDYLQAIPRLDSLDSVGSGTPVLVRGDVDAKPGPNVGEGDIRLRSMADTLQFGRQRGWKQVVFGHIGRKPEGSLNKVAVRLGELLQCEVSLISEWLDEASMTVTDAAAQAIERAEPGSVLMLENTRKYAIERALWKAKEEDLPALSEKLARLVNTVTERIATIYVNEAFAAGSLDASSTVLPAGMQRVALGRYAAGEFDGPLLDCLQARLVVFSGLKIDKLDDLEAMIGRGRIEKVICAGSLAMALKKAAAQLDGQTFGLGVAEDASHQDKPYFIPKERLQQAEKMIADGRQKGIEFILPVDFVLQDGQVAETIGPGDQQFDVGPRTSELYSQKVTEFIEQAQGSDQPAVAFHNGVFGMFEDPRFEAGTRKFVGELKRMTEAGVRVYVGGGEGGAALEKYGQMDWVTHCFTAGGTVLNALGSEPVPYLVALKMAAATLAEGRRPGR